MFDEPFRWMEAISTRHSYVREKLRKGQPVIAVPYKDGALLFGFSPQPGKIFEIYDRIALGGLGHPADVERLRMSLLDMTHIEGFNRSAQDVNIARLLQFGIAPALKQNFEEVQRAPYLIQLVLVELNVNDQARFYRINYDGYWEVLNNGAVISGDAKVLEWIQKEIDNTSFASFTLDKALREAARLWEEGKKHAAGENGDHAEKDGSPATLKEAFKKWNLEAAVLCKSNSKKSLYRPITPAEVKPLKAAVAKS